MEGLPVLQRLRQIDAGGFCGWKQWPIHVRCGLAALGDARHFNVDVPVEQARSVATSSTTGSKVVQMGVCRVL
jgi:hypothetical protein